MQTERSYYLPGEHISGTLSAAYFFGKPVAGGQVHLEGYSFDVQRNVLLTLDGQTDEQGNFTFDFDLPAYLAGSDLDGGQARFYLQAAVTDLAQHSETSSLSLPVSASALVIEAMPEGGMPRQGVENILYLLTSYPDGTPADAVLTVTFQDSGEVRTVETGAYGLAELRYTPASPYLPLAIEAQDQQGNTAHADFAFQGEWFEETVLMRPDRPVYRVGDTMNLSFFTSQPQGTVYLDIVRDGQTVSTRSVDVTDGKAELGVDLTPDLYGTLELHAYKILTSGSITRDTRMVVVDRAADLNLQITPGQDTYRPGDTAALNIAVSGQDGAGVRAALGLAIVDELVFALAEQDPGFAKLYFMLESEILTPRYDLHGFSVPSLVTGDLPTDDPLLRGAVDDAASASLADAVSHAGVNFSLSANSHQDAINRAYELQTRYFGLMRNGIYFAFLLLSLTVVLSVALPLSRAKLLGRSLLTALGVLSFLIVLFLLVPLGPDYAWAQTPGDRLSVLGQWLSYQGGALMAVLALLGLAGYLALIGAAIARKDAGLGWMLGLLFFFTLVLGLLALYASGSGSTPGTPALVAGLIAFLLVPFAIWVRVAGFFYQGRPLAAMAALPVVFLIFLGPLAAAAGPAIGNISNRAMVGA